MRMLNVSRSNEFVFHALVLVYIVLWSDVGGFDFVNGTVLF